MPKPKYQIGDEVWVLQRGKAVKGTITAIGIVGIFLSPKLKIMYALNIFAQEALFEWYEHDLFPTKEELLASL